MADGIHGPLTGRQLALAGVVAGGVAIAAVLTGPVAGYREAAAARAAMDPALRDARLAFLDRSFPVPAEFRDAPPPIDMAVSGAIDKFLDEFRNDEAVAPLGTTATARLLAPMEHAFDGCPVSDDDARLLRESAARFRPEAEALFAIADQPAFSPDVFHEDFPGFTRNEASYWHKVLHNDRLMVPAAAMLLDGDIDGALAWFESAMDLFRLPQTAVFPQTFRVPSCQYVLTQRMGRVARRCETTATLRRVAATVAAAEKALPAPVDQDDPMRAVMSELRRLRRFRGGPPLPAAVTGRELVDAMRAAGPSGEGGTRRTWSKFEADTSRMKSIDRWLAACPVPPGNDNRLHLDCARAMLRLLYLELTARAGATGTAKPADWPDLPDAATDPFAGGRAMRTHPATGTPYSIGPDRRDDLARRAIHLFTSPERHRGDIAIPQPDCTPADTD